MDIASNRTLYSVFAAFAETQPEKEWLIYERDDRAPFRWTYREFLESVHRAANLLCALGIQAGDVFNLHLGNHPAYPQLILAASYLGAVVTPTNPSSTADELSYQVEHSESKLIFTDSRGVEAARIVAVRAGVKRIVLCDSGSGPLAGFPLYETALAGQSTTPPGGAGRAADVVELLYTSGTTARPKGVMLTNASFVYAAEVFRAGSGLRAEDRHLIALPLFHAGAQCHALWPALIAGASVALLSRFSASRYFAQAIAYEATMGALFGALLRMLLHQPPRPTDSAHRLRNITFAQNLTPDQSAEWHHRFRVPLQQIWGMTETCGLPVMSPLTGARNLPAMGRPVLGYELKIIDADGSEVKTGESGQLIVRGRPGQTVMLGYLKAPEATAQTLRACPRGTGTWLFTGDTVRADSQGYLYFIDRGRDLIKRAGENISSTEVEAVVLDCPGVLDACVVGVPDPIRDEAVAAVVVRSPDHDLSAEALRSYCAQHLSPFKVPQRVEFVDTLPRTSVGKIQKQLVREFLARQGGSIESW